MGELNLVYHPSFAVAFFLNNIEYISKNHNPQLNYLCRERIGLIISPIEPDSSVAEKQLPSDEIISESSIEEKPCCDNLGIKIFGNLHNKCFKPKTNISFLSFST